MKRETIEQFQGKVNVIHIINDSGVESYLTQSHSFMDEAYSKGACKLNTVENETKHVLFLFNDKGQEVGRYYIGKKLQGKTPEELAELKHSIVVFESYNLRTKQWVPCVGIQAPPQSVHLHKSKVKEQKPPYPLKNGFIGSKPKYEFTEKMFREELANQKEKDLLEYGTTDNKEIDQIKKEKKEKTKINIILVIIIFIVPILFMGMITTVPLKWTNRSLKSLKLSHLRVVLRVHGFEFVPLQPN